ncbi:Protein CBR-HER-1 [Caenorhabditis briggsae]|uniref:Protein CBR-HER-1 n=2 Tax=Caenorhabditis briggsae TaxID=6238 RepID=A8XVE8_CAEBR|nr:Protein CBR-HER-1 [Caenorhabditis briggsae]ULT90914.1 hypothetical protein L3Y34_008899 [Caenorhabditis briggsae]CAP36615.1 Protein CBR-HER-1 [Caenorhabditis briggsae]
MNRIITLLTIFGLIGWLEASFSNSQIKEAAQKCCTPNRYECCMDMIKFGTPIKCGYERDLKIPALVYNCMQQELFAQEPEKRMNLDDSVCCTVFGQDLNDPNRRCESICKTTMQSPSLDAATKLQKIKDCTLSENVLYQCFTKCQMLRRQDIKIEVLHFNEYCNTTYLQKRPIH